MNLLGFRPLIVPVGAPPEVQFFTGVTGSVDAVSMPVSVARDMTERLRPFVEREDVGRIRDYFRNFDYIPERCFGSLLCTLFLADSFNSRSPHAAVQIDSLLHLANILSPDQGPAEGIAQYYDHNRGELVLPEDPNIPLPFWFLDINDADPYAGEDMRQYFSSDRPVLETPGSANIRKALALFESRQPTRLPEDFANCVIRRANAIRSLKARGYSTDYAKELEAKGLSEPPPPTLWQRLLALFGKLRGQA